MCDVLGDVVVDELSKGELGGIVTADDRKNADPVELVDIIKDDSIV